MAPSGENQHHHGFEPVTSFIQSTTSGFLSLLNPKYSHPPETAPFPPLFSTHSPTTSATAGGGSGSRVLVPLPFSNFPLIPFSFFCPPESSPNNSSSMKPHKSSAVISNYSSDSETGVSPALRVGRLRSGRIGGPGPAFVGQVFTMCDLTGTGLMTVSSHFDIPFLSKRTPVWMKKMLRSVFKKEEGPVFRFFMDPGDAVNYVKRLNIPSGIVGACRLDVAHENFKEKPHLFQFVPNEKQVKEANKLLKRTGEQRSVDGVPVFSAHNLEIAVATTDGIKWYTPYFFDKNILDNILEESSDQHFHSLIQSRHVQRRHDAVDDNLPSEIIEEAGDDSLWESLEVEELMDEVGFPEIPFSVVSKVAEVQLMHAVDSLLLGNRWLRKAMGIQPKFPYMVDSFEKRSAASLLRASKESARLTGSEVESHNQSADDISSEVGTPGDVQSQSFQENDLGFPYGNWSRHPWSKQHAEVDNSEHANTIEQNPLLPKITLLGVSTSDSGKRTSRATLQKTMEKLTKELKQDGEDSTKATSSSSNILTPKERDPLFVANMGDYRSGVGKADSARWFRRANS